MRGFSLSYPPARCSILIKLYQRVYLKQACFEVGGYSAACGALYVLPLLVRGFVFVLSAAVTVYFFLR